ncbi:methylated-DNA--[protein]-cysteine S-methyltransferase [Bradyrhizobium genosp. L]|uniref:methylated-DNA--[protein]-cysteine S-methyltransferase n=1 Tax=Bradyrhizobium genosp. L TaxID=83637 RepID=UPI0018A2C1CE|nr:methylated-DNA--[protein]-cysteine S-methyltransferase [Bradyrhizobium genosp. L]QPF85097.1 methylated-DNA--[protein]-cysteine S-methyltransferase [Bradyrhizobium genosp. L]
MNVNVQASDSRLSSTTQGRSTRADVLFHTTRDFPLGKVLVARSVTGVCAILLGDTVDELQADLARRFPEAALIANEAIVRDDLSKVIRFVENPAEGLRLPLDMRGTPIQRRIWEKMRTIPVGRTVSYLELAKWVNPLASPRVIAAACAANPIALAIPCHRVVRSDGGLAGFRWGIERKRELLRREAGA